MGMKEEINLQRKFLKPNWNDLDSGHTDQSLKIPVPPQEKPYDQNGVFVDLIPKEKWNIGKMSLVDAILNRKSVRKYSTKSLSLEEISFLLFSTQGIIKHFPAYSFRTVPSGGARHTFETYLYIDKVNDIQKGLYRYLPVENKLFLEQPYRENMEKELDSASRGQFRNAAAYFIWTTIPYRMEWRYSTMSAKIIAIDIGHVCQNLYLACEAIGCGTCAIGAYDQDLTDSFLKIDGREEFTIYMAPVGKKD